MTRPDWLCAWPDAYAHDSKDWTITDGTHWARLEPEIGEVTVVDPVADKKLPALAAATRSGRLVSYRIGRRAVVETDSRFVKVLRPAKVDAAATALERAARLGVATPALAGTHADGRIEMLAVPGMSLHRLAQLDRLGDDVVQATAAALAQFHDGPRAGLPTLGQPRPATARRWVARAEPGAEPAVAAVADMLPDLEAGTPGVVHGDLHDKNVMVNGTEVGFIDVDGIGVGVREDDVANLGVHLALRVLQAGGDLGSAFDVRDRFVSAYTTRSPLDGSRLGAAEAHVWFRLGCLYRFRRSSRALAPRLLDLARRQARQAHGDRSPAELAGANRQ